MARTSNADTLKRFRGNLAAARKYRAEEGYDKLWKRMIDLYRGRQFPKEMEHVDKVVVNMAFSTINVIGPSVSINYPKITVSARMPEFEAQAVVTEAIVNYDWEHNDYQTAVRRAVKDSLITGHGWVKTGYRFVDEKVVAAEDNGAYTASADPTSETGPQEDAQNEPSIDDPGAPAVQEQNASIREDRVFVERVSVFDMFVDPDATNMEDVRWICQRIRRPLKDVQKDPNYSPTFRKQVTAAVYADPSKDGNVRPDRDGTVGYADVYEFYDTCYNTMCVFAETGDGFLISPRPIPYAIGHPFTMIRDYEVPEFFYPIGELEQIESLQHELNGTRTQMFNMRKKFAPKYGVDGDVVDEEAMEALTSNDVNRVVKLSGLNGRTPNQVVQPFNEVPVNADIYNQSQLIEGDIDKVSATSEYMRGESPDIRRTATEAAMMQDAQNARSADKLAMVERVIAQIAQKVIKLEQQYLTQKKTILVVGPNQAKLWLTYDRDYIKGDFNFTVVAGSTQPNNESFRRQSALQMVDALAPFIGAGVINMPALGAYVLQYGFGVTNAEQFIQQPPPPMPPGGPGGPPGGPPPPGGDQGAPPPDMMPPPQPTDQPPGAGSTIDPATLAFLQQAKGLDLNTMPVAA